MFGNGIPYLTEVSDPNPFVSTPEFQKQVRHDKNTPFSRIFVIGGIPSASLMGPTGQGIINTVTIFAKMLRKLLFDWKSDLAVCLGTVWGRFGVHGNPNCRFIGPQHRSASDYG